MKSKAANHARAEQIRKRAGCGACTDVSRRVKTVRLIPHTSGRNGTDPRVNNQGKYSPNEIALRWSIRPRLPFWYYVE
jgi:hypothetical protein